MDVAVVSTNRCKQPMVVMPYGACLVAEAAQRAGHRVRFVDMMFETDPMWAMARELGRGKVDVVGLSVRNVDNNDARNPETYYGELEAMVEEARRITGAKVVLGGAAMGVMGEELLRLSGADYGIIGDGETAFVELLGAMERGGAVGDIAGVARIEDGQLRKGRRADTRGMEKCPWADFGKWVEGKRYRGMTTTAPLQTKRGCPYECVYCTYSLAEGKSYRLSDAKSVAEAAGELAKRGFKDIEFVDNVFNSPREHALEVCEELAKAREKIGARFITLELNPRFVDDELLTAMEQAGFAGIGVTAESGSDRVLARMKKGYTSEDARRGARAVAKHKTPCCWIFMMGGPGETKETVKETLDFAAGEIRPKDVAFFNVGVRINPGTGLEKIAREEGVLTEREMLTPRFYVSPGVELGWMQEEMTRAAKKHVNFVAGDTLGTGTLQRILRTAGALGMRPPIWRHTATIRRIRRALGLYP